MATSEVLVQSEPLFDNPFQIEDLLVFDDAALQRVLGHDGFGVTTEQLAQSLHGIPQVVVRRIKKSVPVAQRAVFRHELRRVLSEDQVAMARKCVLDSLFWELTYWKTPGLYEELTEGEWLHPGIFQQLAPVLHNKIVLDMGAGSGRATFECLRYGAKLVHAVEPSPGLLHILKQKSVQQPMKQGIVSHKGRFDAVPLPDNSVDVALSCSAFTALPEQGGERGLAELQRVTKPGGKIVFIWPRVEDHDWLEAHGFHYVSLPIQQEMSVHFRSLGSALHCARLFYAHNKAVLQYILNKQEADVPFSVIGMNPPHDYCWRNVEK
ncbi:MAG: hypothetical protein NVS4B11_25430 [Ktedonobacteraceae bacterium]